ncbi:hypothetical protein BOTNAR_0116g00140 [Botryotinia narcissicola]|uniref:Uncharacterized protein n=1 Tax=Botryotinia narcissicola TaxID=278944 RepID=A0A4Z1J063_9HELO|nr:hypothetical protein BOTNAR_0116g00140 [Botryotinia narcissicola]
MTDHSTPKSHNTQKFCQKKIRADAIVGNRLKRFSASAKPGHAFGTTQPQLPSFVLRMPYQIPQDTRFA